MIDYEKVDKLVENCKKLYPDMPDYVLWVLACDYYINEDEDEECCTCQSLRGRLLGFGRGGRQLVVTGASPEFCDSHRM